jgi:hypothetical protein
MKIIEFPKNIIENNKRDSKFKVAFKLLKTLVDNGADFHIVVDKKDSLLLFNEEDFGSREYIILTSNLEKAKELSLENKNSCIFPIKGDEF